MIHPRVDDGDHDVTVPFRNGLRVRHRDLRQRSWRPKERIIRNDRRLGPRFLAEPGHYQTHAYDLERSEELSHTPNGEIDAPFTPKDWPALILHTAPRET